MKVFTRFRETLNNMGSVALEANIKADYGSYIFDCRLAFAWVRESDSAQITVLEPEAVAGIRAVLKDGQWQLGYDTVMLGAGDLEDRTFSPMTSVYEMLLAWQSMPATAACFEKIDEKQVIHITLYDGNDSHRAQDVRIDCASLLPLEAEISLDGKTVLTAKFLY